MLRRNIELRLQSADLDALLPEATFDRHALAQQIEKAAHSASLNPAALEGVYPQAPRRSDNANYLEYPTTLTWRSIDLASLAVFLHHLTTGTGLSVHEIRVRLPRTETDSRSWDIEITISYRVFEPAPTAERRP